MQKRTIHTKTHEYNFEPFEHQENGCQVWMRPLTMKDSMGGHIVVPVEIAEAWANAVEKIVNS